MNRPGWLLTIATLAALGITMTWWLTRPDTTDVRYRPARVTRGSLTQEIETAGTIRPGLMVEVKSRASGEVRRRLVRDGDPVQKGQLLMELDPTDEQTRVKQAESDLLAAKARVTQAEVKLAQAQRTATQVTTLRSEKLASEEEWLTAQHTVKLAQADLDMAQAAQINANEVLNNAKIRLADTQIRSPISGTVLEAFIEEGQLVASGISATTGGTRLFTLGDLSGLIASAQVDEVDMGRLKMGQGVRLEVDAYPGRTFEGRLIHISPLGTTQSNITVFTMEIEITDPQKALLKPGMTTTARITVQTKQHVLMLPVYAVEQNGRRASVWLKTGHIYTPHEITTGLTNYQDIEIISGLDEGQTVYIPLPRNPGNGNGRAPSARDTARTMRRISGR